MKIIIFLILSNLIFANSINIEITNYILQFEGSKIVKTKFEHSKYGITDKYLKHYNKKNKTNYSIDKLSIEQARLISLYIMKSNNLEKIHSFKIRKQAFDILYNSGNNGLKIVQQATNDYYGYKKIKVDGIIGTKSLLAINKIKRIEHFNELIIKRRLEYYKSLPNWYIYKNGWTKRIYAFSNKRK